MPQIVAAAVAAVGGYIGAATTVGGFLIANAAAVASAALFVGTLALSASARRKAIAAYNASLQDRLVNVENTLAARELVLGRVRKGGPVFFRGSVGAKKETFAMCVALAGHEVDAIESVFFNDVEVTLSEDGIVTSEPYMRTTRVSRTESFTGTAASVSHTLAHTPVADSIGVTFGAGSDDSGSAVPFTVSGSVITVAGDPGGGSFTVNYQSAEQNSFARVRKYLGTADQAADARLITLFPDQWTTDHRARGVAYLVVELTYDDAVFATGVPTVTAIVRGLKALDSRGGLTAAWTENPAILAANVYLHPNFGGKPLTPNEIARIEAAANACDVEHDYIVDGVTTTRPLFTAGLVAPYGAPARDVIDDLVQAMGGQWAYAQGEMFITAGVYTAPGLELDESALGGVVRTLGGNEPQRRAISVQAHRPQVEKVNTITGSLSDQEQDYKVVPMARVSASALVTRDGGAELVQDVQFTAVTYGPQAQHIAGIMLRDARDPMVVTAFFNMRAYRVELFDVINLRLAAYGWSPKAFRVVQRVWSLDGLLQLTLKETAAEIYTPDAEFLPQGYAPNTALPAPWEIDPPEITAISSGSADAIIQGDGTVVPRVRVQWTAITDPSIVQGGSVEVQWSLSGTELAWSSVPVSGAESQAFLLGAPVASVILIRARTRNALAVSDWSVQQSHTVAGQTTPPDAPTAFTVLEQPGGVRQFFWSYSSTRTDIAAFDGRYTVGTGALAWDDMLPLFTAAPGARSHETLEPYGDDTYTFSLRARDSSGNVSSVTNVTAILDGGQYGTLDLLVLPHQESWPLGTRTNCTLVGAELVGAGAGTWSDWSGAWSDLTSWGSASSSSLTYEYPVIDRGSSAARTLTGSAVATGTVTVQYRSSADNVTWTAWASLPGSPVTARYYQFRWTVADAAPVLRRAQAVLYT